MSIFKKKSPSAQQLLGIDEITEHSIRDSSRPVPISATSRSAHSHSIGRAVRLSGYRYISLTSNLLKIEQRKRPPKR